MSWRDVVVVVYIERNKMMLLIRDKDMMTKMYMESHDRHRQIILNFIYLFS